MSPPAHSRWMMWYGKHFDVHQLVLVVGENFGDGLVVLFLECASASAAWRGIQLRMIVFIG